MGVSMRFFVLLCWAFFSSFCVASVDFPVVQAEVFHQGAILKRALSLSSDLFDEDGGLVLDLLYEAEGEPFAFSGQGVRVLSSSKQWVESPRILALERMQADLLLEVEVLNNRSWLLEEAMRKAVGDGASEEVLAGLEKDWRASKVDLQALSLRILDVERSLEKARSQGQWLALRLQLVLDDVRGEDGLQLEAFEQTEVLFWQAEGVMDLDTKRALLSGQSMARLVYQGVGDLQNVRLRLALLPPDFSALPVYLEQGVGFIDENADGAVFAPMMARMRGFDMASDALELQAQGMDFVVDLKGFYNLRAGQELLLVYDYFSFPVDIFNAVYQWGEDRVFLQAQWINERPLWLGKTQLRRNGLWLESQFLPFLKAREKVVLGFGENVSLAVKKMPVHVFEFARDDGLRVREVRQALLLEGVYDDGFDVRVYARLPVSKLEEIKVMERFSPPPSVFAVDGERGQFLWQRSSLSVGEILQFDFDYDVIFPDEQRIFIEGLY